MLQQRKPIFRASVSMQNAVRDSCREEEEEEARRRKVHSWGGEEKKYD